MICLRLPKLAVWPAEGTCEAPGLRSACAETNGIERRKMRMIADFVIKFPPSVWREFLKRRFPLTTEIVHRAVGDEGRTRPPGPRGPALPVELGRRDAGDLLWMDTCFGS